MGHPPGGTTSEFIYGPTGTKLAKVSGATLVKAFIPLPGGAKAIYNSNGLAYYRHSDWLGSSRLTSTATKPTSMYSSIAYAPFGEQYAATGSADSSYTGTDQDTIGTVYDFLARRQSPSQGRWISPDPMGTGAVDITTPETWNRYAYVMNNPLSYVDPLGLFCEVNPGGDVRDNFVVRCKQGEAGFNWGSWGIPSYDYAWVPEADVSTETSTTVPSDEGATVDVSAGPDTVSPGYWEVTGVTFVDLGSLSLSTGAANNCQAPFLCNPIPAKRKKAGPMPLKWWEKAGMVLSCIAGMDPEFATPIGAADSHPSDSTDSTNTTEGQGPPLGPNKGGRMVPYGGSPEVPNGAAGGAAYGAGVGQCITNVFTTWPK